MPNDWSDPDRAERELRRREAEGGELEPGDRSRLEILLEIRERLIGLEAHAADQSEEISSLFDLLARNGRTDSASPRPPPETGLGQRLAEADREILARIDSFGEGVRALGVALPELESLARIAGGTPDALTSLEAIVERSAEAGRQRARAHAEHLERVETGLAEKLHAAKEEVAALVTAEAKVAREARREVAEAVRRRRLRSRRFWLGVAGAALLAMVILVGAGAWLQARYEPLPWFDASRKWRDYIWYEYGPAVRDCIREARKAGREVRCPIRPPRS